MWNDFRSDFSLLKPNRHDMTIGRGIQIQWISYVHQIGETTSKQVNFTMEQLSHFVFMAKATKMWTQHAACIRKTCDSYNLHKIENNI